jgi:hypothetical protein
VHTIFLIGNIKTTNQREAKKGRDRVWSLKTTYWYAQVAKAWQLDTLCVFTIKASQYRLPSVGDLATSLTCQTALNIFLLKRRLNMMTHLDEKQRFGGVKNNLTNKKAATIKAA